MRKRKLKALIAEQAQIINRLDTELVRQEREIEHLSELVQDARDNRNILAATLDRLIGMVRTTPTD